MTKDTNSGANLGFENEPWRAADAHSSKMDAAEYKLVVVGLISLKYSSDALEDYHSKLVVEKAKGADYKDPDEYRVQSIFWFPPEARWAHFKAQARRPTIGPLVEDAMAGIERDNPALTGVLRKDYARPALDNTRLGQLIDLIGADFILAHPPFNVSERGGERLRDDKRWKFGVQPAGNANFAWVHRQ